MVQVIDITGILEERKEEQHKQEQMDYFRSIFRLLSLEELEQVREALKKGDAETYKRITEPIIMREAIREFNKGV